MNPIFTVLVCARAGAANIAVPRTSPASPSIVDRRGMVWYAGNRNAMIGRLDPKDGSITRVEYLKTMAAVDWQNARENMAEFIRPDELQQAVQEAAGRLPSGTVMVVVSSVSSASAGTMASMLAHRTNGTGAPRSPSPRSGTISDRYVALLTSPCAIATKLPKRPKVAKKSRIAAPME